MIAIAEASPGSVQRLICAAICWHCAAELEAQHEMDMVRLQEHENNMAAMKVHFESGLGWAEECTDRGRDSGQSQFFLGVWGGNGGGW